MATGRCVEMLELLPEVVSVDAHHRVLTRVEVGTAAEHFHRDLELFRRSPADGALDEELEQPGVRARPAERAALHDLPCLLPQKLCFDGHSTLRATSLRPICVAPNLADP